MDEERRLNDSKNPFGDLDETNPFAEDEEDQNNPFLEDDVPEADRRKFSYHIFVNFANLNFKPYAVGIWKLK